MDGRAARRPGWLRPPARFLGAALLAAGAAVLIVMPPRTVPAGTRDDFAVRITAQAIEKARLDDQDALELAGAWHLTGDQREFHSLSGMALGPDGDLVAITDRGLMTTLPRPGGDTAVFETRMTALDPDGHGGFFMLDAEAVTIAPDGTRWFTVENRNAIVRLANGDAEEAQIRPPAMAGWTAMRGPESLTRTADGRFLVLGEGYDEGSDRTFPGLLFAEDPTSGTPPELFHLKLSGGMRPVDAVALRDDTVLVLARTFGPPFRFGNAIYAFDLGEARSAARITARLVGRIEGAHIADNHEGMAVEEARDGTLVIWIVSDSNEAQILQSTILLKLRTRKGAL